MTEPPNVPPSTAGPDDDDDSDLEIGTAAVLRTDDPTAQPGPGPLIAAAGAGMVAVSSALAWANQPIAPVDAGVYPISVPVPNLISATSEGLLPNLALVLVALSVPALILALLPWRRPWVAVLRRALGVLIGAVIVLFAIRWNSFFTDDLPKSFASSLRAGFYVAAVGTLLIIFAPAWAAVRPAEPSD